MSYIVILHGSEEEPHEPIVDTIMGGSHVTRHLGTKMVDQCEHCGCGGRLVMRTARYDFEGQVHPAPPPFKGTLVARLTSVTEIPW